MKADYDTGRLEWTLAASGNMLRAGRDAGDELFIAPGEAQARDCARGRG